MYNILLWCTSPYTNWCQSEAASCSSSLRALACDTSQSSLLSRSSNPVVTETLKIWSQIRRHFGWLTLPLATPICNNHLFVPAKMDLRFSVLEHKGLGTLGDLYVNDVFASFNELVTRFNFNKSDLFRYFQLRNFAKKCSTLFPKIPTSSGIDLVLRAKTLVKGHISYLYKLTSSPSESLLYRTKMKWESELHMSFSELFWEGAVRAINSSSSCARLFHSFPQITLQ